MRGAKLKYSKILTKELLKRLYWDELMSHSEIAEKLGVYPGIVSRYMKRLNIKTRTFEEGNKIKQPKFSKILTKELLRRLYCEVELTTREIAERMGATVSTVCRYMKKRGIKSRTPSEAKRGKRHPMYGKHPSRETKRKKSIVQMGERNSFYGKNHSEETKRRISEATAGENNANWRGGTSNLPYNYDWRTTSEIIRKRDDHVCQYCGSNGNCVHHIDGHQQHDDHWNLITLCNYCNSKEQYNRHNWLPYFYCIVKDPPPLDVLSDAMGVDITNSARVSGECQ